jgi:hypothetical protein
MPSHVVYKPVYSLGPITVVVVAIVTENKLMVLQYLAAYPLRPLKYGQRYQTSLVI